MRLKKRRIKVIKCGCKKTKKNRLQRAVAKSQKPKPKPKIDEKNIFIVKKTRKTNIYSTAPIFICFANYMR